MYILREKEGLRVYRCIRSSLGLYSLLMSMGWALMASVTGIVKSHGKLLLAGTVSIYPNTSGRTSAGHVP